ncbi:MAG: FtsX-like permease family protein [Caulobacteraceae bacterium]|nr:FtsX-like permease family protein [Caulobacteraceae bacterium]
MNDREHAAPGLRRVIQQTEAYLGFVGLAALVAGGVAVRSAVAAHLQSRRGAIALMKAFGAGGGLALGVYGLQIAAVTLVGIAAGLAAGAVAPLVLEKVAGAGLPTPAAFALHPVPLAKAAAFGALAAAAFALSALGDARRASPAALLGDRPSPPRTGPGTESIASVMCAIALCVLAIASAPTLLWGASFVVVLALAVLILALLGRGAQALAGRVRIVVHGAGRLGLAQLAGPDSAARTAVPALGLGVTLVAAILFIQSSLVRQLDTIAPATAPTLVFSGIAPDRAVAFDAALARAFARPLRPADYLRAPFASGRIVAVRGRPVSALRIAPETRWGFDHDVGLVALGAEPPNARVVRGRWWTADYAGPPLAAVAAEIAEGGHLRIGDSLTVEVLGRDIVARVAAVRRVDFAAFGPDVPLALDAHALAGAGLAEMAIARATPAQERRATLSLGDAFSEVAVISVREQLDAARVLLHRFALAAQASAAVVMVSGMMVAVGVIAAGARGRRRDSAMLQALGATRGQVMVAALVEYGAVGLIAGLAGLGLGAGAAAAVVQIAFRATWRLDPGQGAAIAVAAGGFTAIVGTLETSRTLHRGMLQSLGEL